MPDQKFFTNDSFDIDLNLDSLTASRVWTFPDETGTYASRTYVDTLFNARTFKNGVVAATTAAVTRASDLENGDVIDGVTLATGDRILVKDQADAKENGIYTVNATGAPTRSTDGDVASEFATGAAVYVLGGTANGDTGWLMNSDPPGADPDGSDLWDIDMSYAQFSATAVNNATDAVSGVIELATDAEALAGTATGGTGASLVVTPPNLDDILTNLIGTTSGQNDLDTFTGDTIADDSSVKGALQALETAVEENAFKPPVRVATTAAGTLASDFENGDTVDGVTLATGDRILIKDQAAGAENGIYVVQATGAPVRATDFDADADVSKGASVAVREGTANAGSAYVMTNDGAVVVGTTAQTWATASGTAVATDQTGVVEAVTTGSSVNIRLKDDVTAKTPATNAAIDWDVEADGLYLAITTDGANTLNLPTNLPAAGDYRAAVLKITKTNAGDTLALNGYFNGSVNLDTVTSGAGNEKMYTVVLENGGAQIRGEAIGADTATSGVVELATDAETTTLTDTARAVTPSNLDALNVALIGTASGQTDLDTFTGDVIADNSSVKGALQSLETAVEANSSKPVVRVATTAAGTLASDFENGDTVDGVTLATGDRILIKDQAAGAENGIYVVAATGAPTRATDFDADADVANGVTAFVREGTANGGSLYGMTNDGAVVVGTTATTWAQVSGGSVATDQTGVLEVTQSGSAYNVRVKDDVTDKNPGAGAAVDWDVEADGLYLHITTNGANTLNLPTNLPAAGDYRAAIIKITKTNTTDTLALNGYFTGSVNLDTTTSGAGNEKMYSVVLENGGGQIRGEAIAADTTVSGIVELATDAETTTLTDTNRAVTPSNLDALNVALIGTASGQTDLDTFTGDIIADDSNVKTAIQALETAIEDRTLANQAEQTAAFTAVEGNKYNVDTAGGAVTATLPAGSAALDGKRIQFKDTAGTWDTNNLTVAPNGADNINGANASVIVPDEYGVVTLEWDNDNTTWLLTKELPSYSGAVAAATTATTGVVELATDAEMAAAVVAANGGAGPLVPTAQQVAVHMNAAGTQWALRGTALSATQTGWTVANLTSDTTLDCNAETLQSLSDIVGTLVTELLAKGLISA